MIVLAFVIVILIIVIIVVDTLSCYVCGIGCRWCEALPNTLEVYA